VQAKAQSETDEEKKPAVILAIYSWDMLLAILALLAALAAFAGQATVGSRTVNVTVGEQVLAAVSAASLAALLIILATLLTRRQRWIRRAQITTFATAIALGAASLVVALLPGQGLQAVNALTSLLLLLLDAIAIVALTGQRVVAWYSAGVAMPRYISATIGFWAASSAVLIIIQALR
jgi:hypothetical protein